MLIPVSAQCEVSCRPQNPSGGLPTPAVRSDSGPAALYDREVTPPPRSTPSSVNSAFLSGPSLFTPACASPLSSLSSPLFLRLRFSRRLTAGAGSELLGRFRQP